MAQENTRQDHRRPLDRDAALSIAIEEGLPSLEQIFGVPFSCDPVSSCRAKDSYGSPEVGWLFQFAPSVRFGSDGRKIYDVRYIVDDLDRRVHIVGTSGVDRAVENILRKRGLL